MSKKLFSAMMALGLFALMFASVGASTNMFVAKGDVQQALGWNNHTLQREATNLTFAYSDVAVYDVPCLKTNPSGTNYQTFEREASVSATVDYDPRRTGQVTGFNLVIGEPTVSGGPITCPGGWAPDGEPVLVEASGGGLTVNGVALPGYSLQN